MDLEKTNFDDDLDYNIEDDDEYTIDDDDINGKNKRNKRKSIKSTNIINFSKLIFHYSQNRSDKPDYFSAVSNIPKKPSRHFCEVCGYFIILLIVNYVICHV